MVCARWAPREVTKRRLEDVLYTLQNCPESSWTTKLHGYSARTRSFRRRPSASNPKNIFPNDIRHYRQDNPTMQREGLLRFFFLLPFSLLLRFSKSRTRERFSARRCIVCARRAPQTQTTKLVEDIRIDTFEIAQNEPSWTTTCSCILVICCIMYSDQAVPKRTMRPVVSVYVCVLLVGRYVCIKDIRQYRQGNQSPE